MKAQHVEMVIALREGKFDEVISARACRGRHVVLEGIPEVRVRRGAGEAVSPASARGGKRAAKAKEAAVRLRLTVVRSLWEARIATSRTATTSSSARKATSRCRANVLPLPKKRPSPIEKASSRSSTSKAATAYSYGLASRLSSSMATSFS